MIGNSKVMTCSAVKRSKSCILFHSVDELGRITKYEYDGQSRLSMVLYPWTEEKAEADRKEASEAGLYFTPNRGVGERITYSTAELTVLRDLLNRAGPVRGNAVQSGQLVWRESYTYDRNGNRKTKSTPWGTIRYEYDAENRLIKKGDVVYTNDKDGNVLSEKGIRYEARYEYNGQNRMTYSEVTSHEERIHSVSSYGYDALGRRTTTQSVTGQTLRTVYDGKGFEVIRGGETFLDGSLTTRFATTGMTANTNTLQSNQPTGERYRWISDSSTGRTIAEDGYEVTNSRQGMRSVTLYAGGEAVAVSYSGSTGSRSVYLGKDLLGSVRTATAGGGVVEDRYEYDAFGSPYKGDLNGAMNLGYTGKPYDTATGLYNYGYRDYKPQVARFTTVDPIRDGNNWYAYVNNDPLNWTDPLGLRIEALKNAGKNLAISAAFLLYNSANLVEAVLGPAAQLTGIVTQVVFSIVAYEVFVLISIFNEEVRADMAAIYFNPFNTDEDAVKRSNSVSFYRGVPVIRFGKKGQSSSFSGGVIFLGRSSGGVLRHERGHNTQLMRVGPISYILGVVFPSLLSFWVDRSNHNKYPWEKGATDYADADIFF